MAIALVSSTSGHGPGTGGYVSSPDIDTTGATLLVVVTGCNDDRAATVSDNKSNTWTFLASYISGSNDAGVVNMWYCANPIVGTGHNFTVAQFFSAFIVSAWSGVVTTSPADQHNGQYSVVSTHWLPGSITPTEDNELVITGLSTASLSTATMTTGGYSVVFQQPNVGGDCVGCAVAYIVQTSAAATNPDWVSVPGGDRGSVMSASFKATGGGGGVTAKQKASMNLIF